MRSVSGPATARSVWVRAVASSPVPNGNGADTVPRRGTDCTSDRADDAERLARREPPRHGRAQRRARRIAAVPSTCSIDSRKRSVARSRGRRGPRCRDASVALRVEQPADGHLGREARRRVQ